jgi:hypothetical protein
MVLAVAQIITTIGMTIVLEFAVVEITVELTAK